MSLGIGLGGFINGFERGIDIKHKLEDREATLADRQLAREDAARARQASIEDRQFALSERERGLGQREAIDKIQNDSRQEFDAAVERGDKKADEFEKNWIENVLPKLKATLIQQNNFDGASALDTWAETEDAKKGTKLFGKAMFQAMSGDHEAAMKTAVEIGSLKGYVDGFEIEDQRAIKDEDGKVMGYRLSILGDDGKKIEQDIAIEDIPKVISIFANPAAAAQTQLSALAAKTARTQKLEDTQAEAQIKRNVEAPTAAEMRVDAIDSLRESMAASDINPDAVAFDDLSTKDKEQLVENELALRQGRAAVVPKQNAIVDKLSGEIARPQETGLGQVPQAPQHQTMGVAPENIPAGYEVDPMTEDLPVPVPYQLPLRKKRQPTQ